MRQVLEALAEIGLTAKPTKCVVEARSLSYLGHMIGAGYTSVPEARIKAILCLPRESDVFTLYTDASYQGIGAVLSTVRDGEERPIGYYSKQLSQAERSYAATEIECLAVVKSVSNFAIHLLGRPFSIVTDHRALTSLMSSSKLNSRLMR